MIVISVWDIQCMSIFKEQMRHASIAVITHCDVRIVQSDKIPNSTWQFTKYINFAKNDYNPFHIERRKSYKVSWKELK